MTPLTGRDGRLVYHPAGPDTALAAVLQDLELGRWRSMRALLDDRDQPALRTGRTQILAAAAARSNVLGVWAAEEPGHHGLAVMQMRVAVEHALKAHQGHHREAPRLVDAARAACWALLESDLWDPVPAVCLIALALTDPEQRRAENRAASPEPMLPPGPWELLYEADRREPGCREAFHRMLRFWQARSPGLAAEFAAFAVSRAWPGSPVLLLPLYTAVEQYREARGRGTLGALQRSQWAHPPLDRHTETAFTGWFRQPRAPRLPLDLNYLAHALVAGGRLQEAGEVFAAIGPFATRLPWEHVATQADTAEREFLYNRQRALRPPRGP